MSDYGDQCRELREAKRATQPSTSRSFIRWLSNQTIPPKSADCGLFACGRSPHSASQSAPTYRRTAMQNDKTTDARALIEALKELNAAATPGPWEVRDGN